MHADYAGRTKRDGALWLWACYCCGSRIDSLILVNRRVMADLFRSSRQWAEAQLFSKVG